MAPTTSTPTTSTSTTRSAALLLALALASPALAQNLANQNNPLGGGRALDANQRVGSGGTNEAARDVREIIRYNQAIVEGTVGGGRAIRGGGAVRSGSEFRDRLSADSFYRFDRDSRASGAVGNGLRSSDVLAAQSAFSSGRPLNPNVMQSMTASRGGGVASGATLDFQRSASQWRFEQSSRAAVLSSTTRRDGRDMALSASTLQGVVTTFPNAADALFGSALERPVGSISLDQADALRDAVRTEELQDTRVPNVVPGSAREAQQTQRAAERTAAAQRSSRIVTRMDDINAAFGQATATGAPGQEDTREQWRKDLDALRERLNQQPPAALPGMTPGRTPAPGTAAPGTPTPGTPAPGAAPTAAPTPAPGTTPGTTPATTPAGDPARGTSALQRLREQNLQIDSLVEPNKQGKQGPEADLYSTAMLHAQKQVAAGRYFDAESTFTRLLALKPGDAMAQVGRAHAQIGAGLWVSAAASLRNVLREQPALIAVRYGADAMVPAARLTEVAAQLQAELARPDSGVGEEAALVLAYLGFQTGTAAWTTQGLDALKDRAPAGSAGAQLQQVLREVWLPK